MTGMAAALYLLVIAVVIVFQFCLIAGAPWGRYTQGGRFEGALPISGRVAAGFSVLLLLCMGAGIASAAGMSPNWPSWTRQLSTSSPLCQSFCPGWKSRSRNGRTNSCASTGT